MSKVIFTLLLSLLFCASLYAQPATATPQPAASPAASEAKPKKRIFRANKDQIMRAQTLLKTQNLYTGEPIGKLDDATRASLKGYQRNNGLRATGTLNRATLEKMGIELTDAQKAIPAPPNSYAADPGPTSTKASLVGNTSPKPRRSIFRATKDQIKDAQKLLAEKGHYSGEQTGKLDDDTRAGLKKFQTANGLKSTGTLNRVTLEKMNIELTDAQKAAAEKPTVAAPAPRGDAPARPDN